MQAREFERETTQRLPVILAELFGESASTIGLSWQEDDHGTDVSVDAGGRSWAVRAKTSSSPGTIAAVAQRFADVNGDATPLLVVPYMTAGGARTAAERGLNWVDLSGNASLRAEGLYVSVQGQENKYARRGRPRTAFAPKSSRIARALLLDPTRWWRQKELAEGAEVDPGQVSRTVHRLADDELLDLDDGEVRARDPDLLLDAWDDYYRLDRHDIVSGHLSGSGMELARELHARLEHADIDHAFTGLPAAWALDPFARFRLVSVYVDGDPRTAAKQVGLRPNERGANVQLIGPDDHGVFDGRCDADGLPVVAPVQVYVDLQHLPERAAEAAEHLRADRGLWTPS